ncbi:MAG: YggU family protein [Pyrinomonadaceae bacterium]|nr:YggU family protein [Pyrinomonadaceae bacterium]
MPRASRNSIFEGQDGVLKISLTAPPVDGEANKELVKFLSKLFGVSKSRVSIVSGAASQNKRIRIDGFTAQKLKEKLRR